jgi:hypothetical protein
MGPSANNWNIYWRGTKMNISNRACLLKLRRVSGPLLATILFLSGTMTAESVLAASETDGNKSGFLTDEFYIAIGGYFPAVDSDIRLDASDGSRGTDFDLEDRLGLDETTATGFGYFRWRFAPRHRVEMEIFALNRDGTSVASGPFRVGNVTGDLGVRFDTTFDVTIGRITYGYSIIHDSKQELGILAGLHFADVNASIAMQGDLTINGTAFTNSKAKQDGNIVLPLPHIGGFYSYAFTPKLTGSVNVVAFYLDVGDVRGGLLEVDGLLHYKITKHFGIGGGVKYFDLDVVDSGDSFRGEFEFRFLGPTLFLTGHF